MLLDNNTKKVFDLIDMYDNLNNVDKVRLAIYLLENKNFYINFNIKDIIKINISTFTVCFIADFHIPSSQWQCSCSHKSSISSSFSSL